MSLDLAKLGKPRKLAGAISRDTMTDLFRRSEVLPERRTNEEKSKLIAQSAKPDVSTMASL